MNNGPCAASCDGPSTGRLRCIARLARIAHARAAYLGVAAVHGADDGVPVEPRDGAERVDGDERAGARGRVDDAPPEALPNRLQHCNGGRVAVHSLWKSNTHSIRRTVVGRHSVSDSLGDSFDRTCLWPSPGGHPVRQVKHLCNHRMGTTTKPLQGTSNVTKVFETAGRAPPYVSLFCR